MIERRSNLASLAALALVACGGPPSMPDVATDAGDESIADALATDVSYPTCSGDMRDPSTPDIGADEH